MRQTVIRFILLLSGMLLALRGGGLASAEALSIPPVGQGAPRAASARHAYAPVSAEESQRLRRCFAQCARMELRRCKPWAREDEEARELPREAVPAAFFEQLQAVSQWYVDTNPKGIRMRRSEYDAVCFRDAKGKVLGRLHSCWELGSGCYYYADAGTGLPVSLTELFMSAFLPERGSPEVLGCREGILTRSWGHHIFAEQDAAFTERLRSMFAETVEIELRVRYQPVQKREDVVVVIRGEELAALLARFAAVPRWCGVWQNGFVRCAEPLGARDVTASFRNAAGEEVFCQRVDDFRRCASLAWFERPLSEWSEEASPTYVLDCLMPLLPADWHKELQPADVDALWQEP